MGKGTNFSGQPNNKRTKRVGKAALYDGFNDHFAPDFVTGTPRTPLTSRELNICIL
jgi:hypothetical protein